MFFTDLYRRFGDWVWGLCFLLSYNTLFFPSSSLLALLATFPAALGSMAIGLLASLFFVMLRLITRFRLAMTDKLW